MENKELKNLELNDDQLEQASGGELVSGGAEYALTGMYGYEQIEEAEKRDQDPDAFYNNN